MPACRDHPLGRALSLPILTVAALLAAFLLRSWFSSDILPPPPRMQGETTQSYRYASMVSESWAIPALDTLVMHPSGMLTSENSIFEEYIAGGLHRAIFPGTDFQDFLRVFCIAFPLLGMIAILLWFREAGLGASRAAMAALAYGFLLPAMLRARGESFYRETVAVPIILVLCWSVEKSTRAASSRASLAPSIVSAILLSAAAASWKASGFVCAAVLFYILVLHIGRKLPLHAVALPAAAQIASALLIPHMRAEGAILSPASVVAFALLVSTAARVTALPVLAAAASAMVALSGFNDATAHVGAMILAKFRFLFMHPGDPLQLTPDARLFWVGGYETPPVGEILLLFGPLIVFALFGARKLWQRGPSLLRWAVPAALAAYMMMDRLHVLLAPVLLAPAVETLRTRWRYPVFGAILALQSVFVIPYSGILEGAGLHFGQQASLLGEEELSDLIVWADSSTDPDEAFLSYWHISGFLSAYAGRPVVTHTFFENASNRRNIEEFAVRIFQPEDSLTAFMRRTGSEYVVHQADFLLDQGPAGLLYLAGLTSPPGNSAAILMQYEPEGLSDLRLVFQGPSLRVFSLPSGSSATSPARSGLLFDARFTDLFGEYPKAAEALSYPMETARSLALAGRGNRSPELLSAALVLVCDDGSDLDAATGIMQELVGLHLDGLYPIEGIAADFDAYLSAFGPDPELRLDLARLYLAAGMEEEAASEVKAALEEDPALAGSGNAADLLWLAARGME